MSSRGGFDAYRQSVLGGRASPCGARLTFSSGQALALRVSLSESHSQNLSALFPLSHSLWVPFSLPDTLHCRRKIDFSKSGFGFSLSHTLSLYLSHKTTPPLENRWRKEQRILRVFFYIRNNAPLLQQNAKRIEIGMD